MLRELVDADAPAVHAWVGDPVVVAHVPLGPLDRAATVAYVAQLVTEAGRTPRLTYPLVIERRRDGAAIGAVTIGIDSFEHRRAELGYILRRDAWGHGYGTEAARLARDFAFDHLGAVRLWAVSDPDNPASSRVLEKIGMRREGVLRSDLVVHGRRRDSVLHAMLADDRDTPEGVYL